MQLDYYREGDYTGVRPSPGAAMSVSKWDLDPFKALREWELAAPEDGRTPVLRPRRALLKGKADFGLEAAGGMRQIRCCQGPWTVDLRTPPGPEGSNGSLLCICRGHPGTLIFECRVRNAE